MPAKISQSPQSNAIDIAVEALVAACGFDKSESASEDFYYLLKSAVENLDGTIEDSHDEGLCYDMTHAISGELKALLDSEKTQQN